MKFLSKSLFVASLIALGASTYANDGHYLSSYAPPESFNREAVARKTEMEQRRQAMLIQALGIADNNYDDRLFLTIEELRGDDTTGVGSPHAHAFRPVQPPHEDYDPRNYDDNYQNNVATGVGTRNLYSPTESEIYEDGEYSVFASRQKRVRFADQIATYYEASAHSDTDSDYSSEWEYYNRYEEEEEERSTPGLSEEDRALSQGFKNALTDLINAMR